MNKMKIKLFVIVAAMLFSVGAQAKLAGKNVILVHGFISEHLSTRANFDERLRQAPNYWNEYWASKAEGYIIFGSHERVEGKIKDSMRDQFLALQRNGKCASGCVFVTHSTGDLVLRDALTRFGQWGIDRNRVKVLSVIDLAGAGGGTGLADLAISVAATGGVATDVLRVIIGAVAKIDFVPSKLGVLNDIRVSKARKISRQDNVYPRLRVAGAGDAFARITKGFIRGYDDSVVGMHSACGSKYLVSAESCSSSIRSNGQLASAKGPGTLLHNHYPIIMGNKADHNELRSNKRFGGALTTVYNNFSRGGLRIDFATNTKRRSWSWFKKVREVNGSDQKSASATIYDTLNR